MAQNPVIVIPGITGTTLHDYYPTAPEDLWAGILVREFERISMHPDNVRFEAIEPARVLPGSAFGIVYTDLILALRHELSPAADRPTPVFAFPYDWRQDVAAIGAQLTSFIDEVIARTKLLKHYSNYGDDGVVDVVAHSMGGLILAEHLAQSGAKNRIGKIATIATPFLGSLEAVVKLTTGMGILSGSVPNERDRQAARSFQSVYQLLPSFPNAVISEPGAAANTDLFDPAAWQPSIVSSLEEFARINSVKATNAAKRRDLAKALLQQFLDNAKAHRGRVTQLDLVPLNIDPKQWLVIAGVDFSTRVQMSVGTQDGAPRFSIEEGQLTNDFPNSRKTGDGTVPLDSAIPPFIPDSNVVAVAQKDFAWSEVQDFSLSRIVGLHGFLPTMNLVQRLVVRHFMPDFGGEVWGRRVPGAAAWTPPISGLTEKQ